MKWIGNLLVILSLAIGALAAATAYLVPLSLSDEQLHAAEGSLTIKWDTGVVVLEKKSELAHYQQRHKDWLSVHNSFQPLPGGLSARSLFTGLVALKAAKNPSPVQRALAVDRASSPQLLKATWEEPAGLILAGDRPFPLARKGDKLTPELVQVLHRQAGSEDPRVRHPYVGVQEFSLQRWPGKWVFLAAGLGLLAGAVILRRTRRQALPVGSAKEQTELPDAALLGVKQMLDSVRPIPGNSQEHMRAIRDRLDEAQRTHLQAFLDARNLLISRLGLAGFAGLMDSYAACERQIFRAWSAAADGYYEEAVACLEMAAELLEETRRKLQQLSATT
jgi:hypothetical protein